MIFVCFSYFSKKNVFHFHYHVKKKSGFFLGVVFLMANLVYVVDWKMGKSLNKPPSILAWVDPFVVDFDFWVQFCGCNGCSCNGSLSVFAVAVEEPRKKKCDKIDKRCVSCVWVYREFGQSGWRVWSIGVRNGKGQAWNADTVWGGERKWFGKPKHQRKFEETETKDWKKQTQWSQRKDGKEKKGTCFILSEQKSQ